MLPVVKTWQSSLHAPSDGAEREVNMIEKLHETGIKSEHAYLGGFVSIGLSLFSWLISRGKSKDKPQADRWGIFIGHWAPTFFALGIALRLEEKK